MGKIDDMRRQREARYEEDQRTLETKARKAPAAPAPAARPAAPPPATAPVDAVAAAPEDGDDDATDGDGDGDEAPAADAPAADATTGVCSACGKVKPLHGDKVAPHQKGLGKACPGSRKPPR